METESVIIFCPRCGRKHVEDYCPTPKDDTEISRAGSCIQIEYGNDEVDCDYEQ